MNPLAGHARRLLVGGLLAVALLYLFFRGLEWATVAAAFRSANVALLLGIIVTTTLCYIVRAWRWGYLLAPLARVPFRDLFSITIVGFTSAFVVPRAGEVLRPLLVGRRHHVPAIAAFASIILERLLDLITVLTLFALYLFVLPAPTDQTHGPLLATLKGLGAMTAAGTLVLIVLLWALHAHAARIVPLVDRGLRWLPAGLGRRLSHALHSFAEGLAVLHAPPSHLLLLFGQSLLLWLSIAAGFHLNHLAFGLTLPFHATFLLCAFLTVGVAIPTPGMIGGFHAFYRFALTEAFGQPAGVAAAAGITAHAMTNLPVLALGLYFVSREGLSLGAVARMTEGDAPPAEGRQDGEAGQEQEQEPADRKDQP